MIANSIKLKYDVTKRILILSSAVTAALLAGQFAYDYLSGLRAIQAQTASFLDLQMGSLAKAEWDLNQDQRAKIIEGVMKDPSVAGVTLKLNDEEIQFGDVSSSTDKIQRSIVHADPSGNYPLGQITIYVTDKSLIITLKNRFMVIAISQLIKTVIMVLGILAIIDSKIIARLGAITNKLDSRRERISGDEIDVLDAALKSYSEQLRVQSHSQGKIESEMEAARAIQGSLLSNTAPIPGLDIAYFYQSAEKVGGDWFGYYYDALKKVCFLCCGDVTGHGVPSAIITGVATGAVEAIASLHFELSKHGIDYDMDSVVKSILQHTNTAIFNTGHAQSKAMTMAVMAINLETGMVTTANAGHNHPLVIGKKKTYLVANPGGILGLNPVLENITVKRIQLEPGDRVFMYTDGLIENTGPSGRSMDLSHIKRKLSNTSGVSSKDVLSEVLEECRKTWDQTPPQDDCTVALYGWLGRSDAPGSLSSLHQKSDLMARKAA